MKRSEYNPFLKKEYKILLVDDHMGNFTSANFLQYKLNKCLSADADAIKHLYGDIGIVLKISPEQHLRRLEYRLKSEPFDLILLDLDFRYDHAYSQQYDDFMEYIESEMKYIKSEDSKKELGAYWLKQEIRPFNPAIPVIIFTSKYEGSIEMASKYGLYGFHADYFEKVRLLYKDENDKKDGPFSQLLFKILDRIRTYENDFVDKIEVNDNREELPLAAKNRDYMQTRLWNVLTGSIKKSNKFAVVFLDIDGMKKINEALGYARTNGVIKRFTELIEGEIEETWKKVKNTQPEVLPLDRPVLGRFFRERGDEFLIFFPRIMGGTAHDDGKKGIIEFLEHLRATINTRESQNAIFNIDEKNKEGYRHSLKLASSMGLLVFPDDLTIDSFKKLKRLEEGMETSSAKLESEWCSNINEIYSEITQIPQKLKENAKLLGKNQFCYYHECGPLTGSSVMINSRVNVAVIFNKDIIESTKILKKERDGFHKEKNGLKEFLGNLTDSLAFDFDVVDEDDVSNQIARMKKENRYYHLLLMVGYDKVPDCLSEREKEHGFILWKIHDKDGSGELAREMPNLNLFVDNEKWILNDENRSEHHKMVTAVGHIRRARSCFFKALEDLADRNYNDEYFPRFLIQDAIHNKFEELKKDVAIIQGKDIPDEINGFEAQTQALVKFAKGLLIGLPQDIWIQRRVSNKDGENKYNVIVPIQISEVAYKFLRLESGRNFVKLQHYLNGLLKGLLANSPDKEMKDQVVEEIEDITSPEYSKQKALQNVVLCRLPFFSPVSPNIYRIITQPSRVRLDEDIRKGINNAIS